MLESLEGPAFLFDGRIFYPANVDLTEQNEYNESLARAIDGILFVNSISAPLFPGPSLEKITEHVMRERYDEFEEEINNKIKEIYASSDVNIEHLVTPNHKILKEIVFKIMPNFVELDDDGAFNRLINGKSSVASEEDVLDTIIPYLDNEEYLEFLSDAENDISSEKLGSVEEMLNSMENPATWDRILYHMKKNEGKDENTIRIDNLINKKNGINKYYFIYKDRVYNLVRSENHEDMGVILGEQIYNKGPDCGIKLSEIITQVAKEKAFYQKKEKLSEILNDTRNEIKEDRSVKKIAVLNYLVSLDNFEIEDFGFSKINGVTYDIYTKVDPYVLQNEDGDLFLFPEAKIASKIQILDTGAITYGKPFIMGEYMHPFLHGEAENGVLCLGGYQYTNISRTLEYAFEGIMQTKKILLSGYNLKESFTPYNDLDFDEFGIYNIERNDPRIITGRLKITNK